MQSLAGDTVRLLALHTQTCWYSSAEFFLTSITLSAVPSCDSCADPRCYRMMLNASMVFSLEQILYVEDKNLLSGHVLVLLGHDYNAAQASALICHSHSHMSAAATIRFWICCMFVLLLFQKSSRCSYQDLLVLQCTPSFAMPCFKASLTL